MTPNKAILISSFHKLKLDLTKLPLTCIEHTGFKDKDGYSMFQFRNQGNKYIIGSHRAAYIVYNDADLTKDDVVRHTCDNPACMNPLHLKIGTHYDNVRDRVKRGRSACGVINGRFTTGKYVKAA